MLDRLRCSIFARFLLVAVPCFVVSLAIGLVVMSEVRLKSGVRELTARVGMHAGAVSTALGSPEMLGERHASTRVLTSLLADPAVLCAEVHGAAGGPAILAAPAGLGCTGQAAGELLRIPLSQSGGPILSVRFTTEEIARARRVGSGFDLALVCLSFLLVVGISFLAFRHAVTGPLGHLDAALRDTSTAAFRRAAGSSSDEIGRVIRAFNAMQDRLEVESAALAAAHSRIRHIYDATPSLLFCIDAEGLLIQVSEHWLEETGHGRDVAIGTPLAAFIEAPAPGAVAEVLADLSREGNVRNRPLRLRCRDGRMLDVLLSAASDRGAPQDAPVYLCVMADVSRLRSAEQEMRRQAATDHLTGLPNRFALNGQMSRLLGGSGESPVAVMFIDLDNFKRVNDTHGHAAGDVLLVEAATRLRAAVGPEDFVARLGGDEFAVLCPDARDPKILEAKARSIIESFGRPIELETGRGHVGASIGIACADGANTSARDLLRCADLAMYDAKRAGRNTYRVHAAAQPRSRGSQHRAA
jgi:diguanylate cyclase (GGDEF)-like protein/PAS domain S-box-containing protein